MIRFRDALLLASTKLRMRKVRTIVTATLASLMFVAIVFGFSLARGAIDSYQKFTASGLSDRYIANLIFIDAASTGIVDGESAELIAKAKARHKVNVAEKTAEAKRLGIDYDPSQEPSVTSRDIDNNSESLNDQNRAAAEVILESHQKAQADIPSRIAKLAKPYHPTAQYRFEALGDGYGLSVMKNGREDLSSDKSSDPEPRYGIDSGTGIETVGYLPLEVSQSFVLAGADQTKAVKSGDQIPVIVPYGQAEAALGLKPLGKKASNQDKINRLKEVKQRANGAIIEACYRNSASRQLVEMARTQIEEVKKNSANKQYQLPDVEYALPSATSCGPIAITNDRRQADLRDYEQKQHQFAIKFGEELEPIQRKLTFRIIGISPDFPDWNDISTAESLLMMIGGTSLQGQWIVPTELVDPALRQRLIPTGGADQMMQVFNNYNLVEFASADDLRRFSEDVACNGNSCRKDQPYVGYFGSNSILIDDILRGVVKVMAWAVLVVAAIAAVLMAGMAGRVITDSRRETAVFRAIGARRGDIRMIYTLYMLLFSIIVAFIALGLGLAAAWIVSLWQAENFTTVARLMFIESNYDGKFSLVGVWPLAMLAVGGVVVLTGLISVTLPLLRSLVRSPLRDMRDE